MRNPLYRSYSAYLRELFGCRVQKISLDAGLTCPNRDGTLGSSGCLYCNARGSGTGASLRSESLTEQIRLSKAYLTRRFKAKKFLAYFQSFTNTYAPVSTLERLYGEALADPDMVGLIIGTRPDCVSDETLDLLEAISRRHHVWIEYGLQSSHNLTLARIRRGHTVKAFEEAVRRTRSRNIPVCAHVILGLPGESREQMLGTARFLANQDVQSVKIHLLYVVRGTTLEEWYRDGKYTCLTREAYTSLVGEFLGLLPPRVVIQRITGDPHPDELVAPRWALEKQRNIQEIHSYMIRHDLHQGKWFPAVESGRQDGCPTLTPPEESVK